MKVRYLGTHANASLSGSAPNIQKIEKVQRVVGLFHLEAIHRLPVYDGREAGEHIEDRPRSVRLATKIVALLHGGDHSTGRGRK